MAEAIERWGGRFLDRVFTPAERAYCDSHRRPAVHYAGRFAAKEAVAKALGTGVAFGVRWRDVEVERPSGSPPLIRLHGAAGARARALGAGGVLLSITHTGRTAHAAAVLTADAHVDNSVAVRRRPRRGAVPTVKRRLRRRRPSVDIFEQAVRTFSRSGRAVPCPTRRCSGYSGQCCWA